MAEQLFDMYGGNEAQVQSALDAQKQAQIMAYAQMNRDSRRAANMYGAGMNVGNGIAGAMGYTDPNIKKAQDMQRIQQEVDAQGIDVSSDPIAYSKLAASAMLKAGYRREALQALNWAQKQALTNSQITKNLREQRTAGMTDFGKLMREQQEVQEMYNMLPEDDPRKATLRTMLDNYNSKIEASKFGETAVKQEDRNYLLKLIQKINNNEQVTNEEYLKGQAIYDEMTQEKLLPDGTRIQPKLPIYERYFGKGAQAPESSGVTTNEPTVRPSPYQSRTIDTDKGTIVTSPQRAEEKYWRDMEDLTTAVNKSGIGTQDTILKKIEDVAFKSKDIPGVGPFANFLPSWAKGSQAAKNFANDLTSLFNITLKDRSGATVTSQELDRLRDEFNAGKFKTTDDLRYAISRVRSIVQKHIETIYAGYPTELVANYNKRIGAPGAWELQRPWREGQVPTEAQKKDFAGKVKMQYQKGYISKKQARALLQDAGL